MSSCTQYPLFLPFSLKNSFCRVLFFLNKKCTWKSSFRKLKILYASRATLSPGKKIHYFHNLLYMHVSILWTMTMQCSINFGTCYLYAYHHDRILQHTYGFFLWLAWNWSVNLTTTPPFLPRYFFPYDKFPFSIVKYSQFKVNLSQKVQRSKKRISKIHTELPWSSSSMWFWMYYCISSLLFSPSTQPTRSLSS